MDQYYFTIPFASLGDQTVPPLTTTTSGSISMQQGWGPDYALDPDTNPSALPIDRATTNWLLYAITQALAALQQTGIPQWITAANNNGVAFPYAKYSTVRYSATTPGVVFNTYVSVIDNNTDTPGTTANWQPIASIVAAAADVVAGTSTALPVTPATLKSYPGNATQTFAVASATAANMAPQAAQVQQSAFNYAGVAGGSANALTATLAPVPAALTDDLVVVVRIASTNTGAATLNLNGLGVVAIVGQDHAALQGSELFATGFACFAYSTSLAKWVLVWATGGAEQVGNGTQSQHAVALNQLYAAAGTSALKGIWRNAGAGTYTWTVPTGVTLVWASGTAPGSGGAGGGGSTNVVGTGAGGAGGSAGQPIVRVPYAVVPGSVVTVTIGSPSAGGAIGSPTVDGGASAAAGNVVISGTGFNGGTNVTLTGGGASLGGLHFSNAGVPAGGQPSATGFPQGSCGADGATGFNGCGIGGAGASGPFGGGGGAGRAGSTGVGGAAANGFGSGGGGGGGGYGASSSGANGGAGGAGSPGFMMFEW
jgi:hypothetical protein